MITSSEILRALWHDGEVQLCPEGARYGHHGQRLSQRRTLRSRRRPASSLRPSMADGKTWSRLHRGGDGAGATRSGRDGGSASVMVLVRVASSTAQQPESQGRASMRHMPLPGVGAVSVACPAAVVRVAHTERNVGPAVFLCSICPGGLYYYSCRYKHIVAHIFKSCGVLWRGWDLLRDRPRSYTCIY